ncbi:hypothetical protein [Bradyrhizobium phage BDU-MI-1]|nr:hypothetical protein [Bradyrhizobium phage BDU-MI-1]
MSTISVTIDRNDIARLNKRLADLLHDVLHLEPVMAEAAAYMKRSTENRFLRTNTAPNGERWAALRDVTLEMKGNDDILIDSGELSKSIQIDDVSATGFMISSNSDHASFMQDGVKRTGGWIRNKTIPPRPFLGFSDENKRRISKLIRDYLANGGD